MSVIDGIVLAGWIAFWIHWLAVRFPDTYPGCKRSTKMLIPFVF